MSNHLYFVCPTDKLECVINTKFKQKNYFFTSLGNSMVFDNQVVAELNNFIETKNIKQITFVLSNDNKIVMDALLKKEFSKIKGLQAFYQNVDLEKKSFVKKWKMDNIQIPIIETYLAEKIAALKAKLNKWLSVELDSKLYDRSVNTFRETNYNLLYNEYFCLN